MAMTHTLASSEADGATGTPSTSASMAVVVRETPVVVKSATLAPGLVLTQYYQYLRVEGFADLLPEQIEIDPTPILSGGEIRIDQIALPPCCEIIGVWFANPVISVEQLIQRSIRQIDGQTAWTTDTQSVDAEDFKYDGLAVRRFRRPDARAFKYDGLPVRRYIAPDGLEVHRTTLR